MRKIFFSTYICVLLLFVVFSYIFVDRNLFYLRDVYTGFALNHKGIATIMYMVFIFLFFLFYFFLCSWVKKNKIRVREFLFLFGITVGILLLAYPAMLSYDVFNYMTTAKVIFLYHENPYVVMPIEFINEPFLSFTRAANKVALYGPAWILLTGIPYIFSFQNFLLLLFGFKILVTSFYIGTIYLIWRLTKNHTASVLFALNPLVVIETLVSGHNDIVMMFFVLLSYYFIQKKKNLMSIIAFILSALIKYVTLALLPVFIFLVLKTLRKEKINWNKIFSLSVLTMIGVFLLSPIREEFYPWYVIWFFSYAILLEKKHPLFIVSVILTFSTLLRYIPVIFTGSYEGITPIAKEILTFFPLVVVGGFFVLRKLYKTYVV